MAIWTHVLVTITIGIGGGYDTHDSGYFCFTTGYQLPFITSRFTLETHFRFTFMYKFTVRCTPIEHCMIKFVSDLRQVGCFFRVFRIPPPIKLTDCHDITKILLKVVLSNITSLYK